VRRIPAGSASALFVGRGLRFELFSPERGKDNCPTRHFPLEVFVLFSSPGDVVEYLGRLHLGNEGVDGIYVVDRGEVSVAGERVAFFAVDENSYP